MSKVTAMPGNSPDALTNVYRDTARPWVTYHGTRGGRGKGQVRNTWYIEDERTGQRTGAFIAMNQAWAHVHRDEAPEPGAVEMTPPAPQEDYEPIITFNCPSCRKPIVALIAAR